MWLSFPKFVHWTARLMALLVAGMFLTIVAGEMMSPHSAPPTTFKEWTGVLLLSLAVVAMLAAWKWELYGAVVSLAALTIWSVMVHFNHFPVALLWLSAPGLLFLSDWALHFGMQHDQSP